MKKYLALLMLPSYITANICCLDGTYVYADALYLKPSTYENNYVVTDYSYFKRLKSVNKLLNPLPSVGPVGCEQGTPPKFHWGYRVGVGSLFNCEKNDVRLEYTHFNSHIYQFTEGSKKVALWPTYGYTAYSAITSKVKNFPATAENTFDTHYNAGNIEIGALKQKACWYNLRTAFGLHLARIKTTKAVSYFERVFRGSRPGGEVVNVASVESDSPSVNTNTPVTLTIEESFSNESKTWGVGPRIASEIDCPLFWGIGVEGKAGFAVLAGKNETINQASFYSYTFDSESKPVKKVLLDGFQNVKNPYTNQVFPEIETSIGLNYDTGCRYSLVRARISVGYEFKTYLSAVRSNYYQYINTSTSLVQIGSPQPTPTAYSTVVTDPYSLQGLYIRASLNF